MEYTLITGATSDIGIQIAKTLEESGHKIIFSDYSKESLLVAIQQMSHPEEHCILPLDLSDVEESKNQLTMFISSTGISISHAVFAAGIFAVKPIKMIDYTFLKKSFDIAVFSIYAIVQALSSKRINGNTLKSIVLISSVNTKIGSKGYSVYAGLKSAMIGMVKSFAVELAPRVRVNAVLPGAIKTRTTAFIFDSQDEPNPRYLLGDGKPTDVANLIEFLLSDRSSWITGQEFVVDGGLTIC